MSLKIIKAGILDTIQDLGRLGHRHLGINPGGVMDGFSATIANLLVGNSETEAVIELHFPASTFMFQQPALISITGADFTPSINGDIVPLWQPILVSKHSVLQFSKLRSGARCYLAIRNGLHLDQWLNSYSTNLKAEAGGWLGRSLIKEDLIEYKKPEPQTKLLETDKTRVLPWKANPEFFSAKKNELLFIKGAEWDYLSNETQQEFLNATFTISAQSDRMGFHLDGYDLARENYSEMISSAVCFGTLQLIPSGKLIVLMADHQTTGGYPRIGYVISACHSALAQLQHGNKITFKLAAVSLAEELMIKQKKHLLQIKSGCIFNLKNYLDEKN